MSTEIAALNIKVETQQTKAASAELDKLTAAGAKTEQQTKKLETATDQMQRSMSQLRGVVGGLAAALGAYKIGEYIKSSAMLAARYETLGITMTQAGHNAGYTKQQMEELETSLRSQGIAGIEAREVLTRLAASHMDLGKASELARAAQNLAVVANINSSEAFERLVRGIQSGEVEVLRSMGLNVNFEQSYKNLAKQLNINADQLTQQEKMQARSNATLEASKGYAGLYEHAMGTAGKQIQSFTRYWKDAQVELGNSELPALTGMVAKATVEIKNFQEYVKRTDVQEKFAVIGQSASTAFDAAAKFGGVALDMTTNILSGWNSLPEPIKEYGLLMAIMGGKRGMLIGAGVAAVSDYADRIDRVGEAIAKFRSGQVQFSDIPLFSQDKFEAWERAQKSIVGIQQRLASVRQELASGAGVSFYSDENEARRQQLLKTEADLLGQINAERARAKTAGAVALPEGALKTQEKEKRELTTAQIEKARTATASLMAELAKANDVSDEGTGKVAELKKKYDEYAHTLGRTNPLVKQFGLVLEFARGHLGHTPAEVHKATEEVLKHNRALESEIDALNRVADLYGDNYTDTLSMLRAETAAQEQYTEAIKKGVSAQDAMREKSLSLAKAQAEIDARKQQGGKALAVGFSGPAYEAERDRITAEYRLAIDKEFATDRVALEMELNRKLASLESARLKKTENPYDGMKAGLLDYAESVGTASSRMANLWGSSFKSMEDALSNFVGNGEMDVESLFKTIRTEIARTQVVQPLLSGLSSGSLISGLSGMFSGLFNADGNAFGPAGLMAFANGGVVSSPTAFRFGAGGSNLGIMGEAGPEAIMPLKRGSDGKLGVASQGGGGTQTVTVQIKDSQGKNAAPAQTFNSTGARDFVINVVLDGINNNTGGLRTALRG